jgi:hypothetical protein
MGFATQGALIAGAAGLNMLSGSTAGMGAAMGNAMNKGVDGAGQGIRRMRDLINRGSVSQRGRDNRS